MNLRIQDINKDLLPSGYLGVDVFFVISGYVITSSLWGSPREGLLDFLLHFYTRRMKRLVPALTLCVLVTGVLVCLFNPNCSVPDDHIDKRRFPLFLAREVLRGLIEQLQQEPEGAKASC
jgi:peptidoglycan/LPS O-acetylase OafA/YrhL